MNKMQKLVSTDIVQLDRNSQVYIDVMSAYLRVEKREDGEELANENFENVNEEFANGTKTTYTFDDGTVRVLIQLNFLSPTTTTDTKEYSNHIQNWCLIAGEEDGEIFLIQGTELHTFCMHEGGH
jgi:hypothetical protein